MRKTKAYFNLRIASVCIFCLKQYEKKAIRTFRRINLTVHMAGPLAQLHV